jgi:hypothetical protein
MPGVNVNMNCESCGITIPPGWPVCLDCGARTGSGPAATPGQHVDVFPLLAAANLSRIRGNYAEAERKCMELLRQHPVNPAPQSLLGQIYDDQGRYRDAIAHYQLALELDPTSETDRSLLARAKQRQTSAERRASFNAVTLTTNWWNHYVPPATQHFWLAIGILGFVCLVELLTILTLSNARRNTPLVSIHNGGSENAAGILSSGEPAETPPEHALLQQMGRATRSGIQPFTMERAEIDPRMAGNYARLTVRIDQPLSPADPRPEIEKVAAATALSAGSVHLDQVSIRVVGSVGPASPALLFAAEARPANFSGVNPTSVSDDNMNSLFQNVWWSPTAPPS